MMVEWSEGEVRWAAAHRLAPLHDVDTPVPVPRRRLMWAEFLDMLLSETTAGLKLFTHPEGEAVSYRAVLSPVRCVEQVPHGDAHVRTLLAN